MSSPSFAVLEFVHDLVMNVPDTSTIRVEVDSVVHGVLVGVPQLGTSSGFAKSYAREL